MSKVTSTIVLSQDNYHSTNDDGWMDGVANLNQSSPFDDVDDDDADDHNNNNNNNNPLQVTTTDIQPSLILKR